MLASTATWDVHSADPSVELAPEIEPRFSRDSAEIEQALHGSLSPRHVRDTSATRPTGAIHRRAASGGDRARLLASPKAAGAAPCAARGEGGGRRLRRRRELEGGREHAAARASAEAAGCRRH